MAQRHLRRIFRGLKVLRLVTANLPVFNDQSHTVQMKKDRPSEPVVKVERDVIDRVACVGEI
jgi:hypothetical protein